MFLNLRLRDVSLPYATRALARALGRVEDTKLAALYSKQQPLCFPFGNAAGPTQIFRMGGDRDSVPQSSAISLLEPWMFYCDYHFMTMKIWLFLALVFVPALFVSSFKAIRGWPPTGPLCAGKPWIRVWDLL